jgi:hypothetical protein
MTVRMGDSSDQGGFAAVVGTMTRVARCHTPSAICPAMTVQLVPLSDAVAPSRTHHHRLINEVRAWALAHGLTVDADILAVHLAVAEDDAWREGGGIAHWTRPLVNSHVMHRSPNWCSMRRVLIPIDGFCEALWLLLTYLDEVGQLDATSDALEHLVEPLICYGGLDFDGRPRDDEDGSPIECACYFPVGTPLSVVRAARQRDEGRRRWEP